MDKTRKIQLITLFVLIGFIVAVFFHYVQGFYLRNPYPYNTFLYHPLYFSSDFLTINLESTGLSPYLEAKSGQYPFIIIIGKILSLIPGNITYFLYIVFCTFNFVYLGGKFIILDSKVSKTLSLIILCFLSYPFLFVLDRGNLEFLLFVFLLGFIFLFEKEKYSWSTIPLACAIAMKIYPAIFLALFIAKKKWKEFFLTLGLFIGTTISSLAIFEGGLKQNLNYLLHLSNYSNNPNFIDFTSIEPGAIIQRGVSITSLIKIILEGGGSAPTVYWINHFSLIYLIAAFTIGMFFVGYVILSKIVLWKKVAILTFLMLLLPPISGDYKLLHLYLPIFLFCACKQVSKYDMFYVVLFSILLIPKSFYYLADLVSDLPGSRSMTSDISIAIPVNIILLIIFTISLLVLDKEQKIRI